MKIDKDKLVELLVEKTSMEKHEVEAQLEQLIDRIISATKRGKALEIKDFGTFYFDSDNELKFDPSSSLSTEISYKYAGMQPVELVPERDTSIPVVDPETEEPAIEADIEDPEPVEADEVDTEDTAAVAPPVHGDEGPDTDSDPDPGMRGDALDEAAAGDHVTAEASDEESGLKDPEAAVPSGETQDEPEQKEKKSSADTKRKAAATPGRAVAPGSIGYRRKRKSGAIVWVLLLILLVGGALAAYFYLADGENEASLIPEDTTELSAAGQQIVENGALADGSETFETDADNVEEELVSATTAQNGNTQLPNETAPAGDAREQTLYGLKGEVIPQANDGYSIVLHSFDEESKTEEAVQNLIDEEYRVIVGSRTVAGRVMWRISVGQFQTLQDAQDAAIELPPPFNTQNFIHRIQLNN